MTFGAAMVAEDESAIGAYRAGHVGVPGSRERAVAVGFALRGAGCAATAHAGRRRNDTRDGRQRRRNHRSPSRTHPFGQLGPAASAGLSSKRIDPLQPSAAASAASRIGTAFTLTAPPLRPSPAAVAAPRARCRSAGRSGTGDQPIQPAHGFGHISAPPGGERRGEEIVLFGEGRGVEEPGRGRRAVRRPVRRVGRMRAAVRDTNGRRRGRAGRPHRSRHQANLAARESNDDHALLHHDLGADERRAGRRCRNHRDLEAGALHLHLGVAGRDDEPAAQGTLATSASSVPLSSSNRWARRARSGSPATTHRRASASPYRARATGDRARHTHGCSLRDAIAAGRGLDALRCFDCGPRAVDVGDRRAAFLPRTLRATVAAGADWWAAGCASRPTAAPLPPPPPRPTRAAARDDAVPGRAARARLPRRSRFDPARGRRRPPHRRPRPARAPWPRGAHNAGRPRESSSLPLRPCPAPLPIRDRRRRAHAAPCARGPDGSGPRRR